MGDDSSSTIPDDPEPSAPEDWVSAADAIRAVRLATLQRSSEVTILTWAFAGLVRARADAMFKRGTREDDVEVPNIFWWATGHAAIEQNWETGDFATTVPPRTGEHVQVYGVRFHRVDLNKRIPGLFEALKPIGVTESGERGGRPMSPLWPEWVAELVAVIDEQGIPAGAGSKGTEELIQRVADALAVRELEAPGRSTVQDTVKAVLRRMRSARN